MLFVIQEERGASDTVLFTSENSDIANQSVDSSVFASEKNRMTNQPASLARRDYFYLTAILAPKSRHVYNKLKSTTLFGMNISLAVCLKSLSLEPT